MIIVKTYNFNIKSEKQNFLISSQAYKNQIISLILRDCYNFLNTYEKNVIIIAGSECLDSILDFKGFIFNSISNKINNIEYIGSLLNYRVYFDIRLESNNIIYGSSLQEVDSFITIKDRKNKILKLKEITK